LLGRLPGGSGTHGDVTVGDHADELVAVAYGNRTNIEFIHQLRRAAHAFFR
jgi:N-dimethylarginine dimethylaminohydrolase